MPRFFFLSECATMASPGAGSPGWRWYLPLLLAATAAVKVLLAWTLPGFLTGDDLEIVETAARHATGLDYSPWAIRSMLHPLGLAWPVVELGTLAGLADPHWLTFLACVPTIFFSTLGIWLLYRLALALSWSHAEARVAAFLFAVHGLPFAYGATQYPRPISTCLLLGAFLLAARNTCADGPAFTAGVLAAAAMTVRWSEGLMLAPLVAFAAWKARGVRRPAVLFAGFLAGLLVLAGLLDLWTWGRPFASLIALLRLSGDPKLGGFHARAWSWYGTMLLQWAGPLCVLLAVLGWGDRRSRVPLAIAFSSVALFSLSPLKQLRYMQAVIPFLALSAALGWSRLRAQAPRFRRLAAATLVLAVPVGIERTVRTLDQKSEAAIAAARVLSRAAPAPRRVALEQAWAWGERLYLGNGIEIRDLPPRTPLEASSVRASVAGADAAGLYVSDVDGEVARVLFEAGLSPCATFQRGASRPVTLYLSAAIPCPEVPASDRVTSGRPRS
jgi:hypothetical protein